MSEEDEAKARAAARGMRLQHQQEAVDARKIAAVLVAAGLKSDVVFDGVAQRYEVLVDVGDNSYAMKLEKF